MVILLWGGIFWRDRDTVLDTGPLKVETSERRGVALPPLLGAAVLVAGIVLVLVPNRRT
jgi:di/tricarboxylate transporter